MHHAYPTESAVSSSAVRVRRRSGAGGVQPCLMWRQSLQRQVDDIGHYDAVNQRNIHEHSHSDISRADGGFDGTRHRITGTAARNSDRWADGPAAAGNACPAGNAGPACDPADPGHSFAAADPYALTPNSVH